MGNKSFSKPSVEEAEEAVRVLIRWLGDDPKREGLVATPRRVLGAYAKSCSGYGMDEEEMYKKSVDLENSDGYSDMLLLKGIVFSSNCEHHLVPICGEACISYIPRDGILGVGKLIKVIDIFSKRLQLQERITVQVAKFLEKMLNPLGVAVFMEAKHWCVECCKEFASNSLRMQTSCMLGVFREDHSLRKEFFSRITRS